MRLDKRFTLSYEYVGQKSQRHVLRFCGDFIASFANLGEGEAALAAVMKDRSDWVLIRVSGDNLRLYAGQCGYRVAYGADVSDYTEFDKADNCFNACRQHAMECDHE